MGATANGYRYPDPTDTIGVVRDIKALAEDVDAAQVVQDAAITANAEAIANLNVPAAGDLISTDADNAIVVGGDGLLYVPAGPQVTDLAANEANGTVTLTWKG